MKLSKPVLLAILLLLLPVFLLNLGLPAFIDDEGNRALVALEMGWSGNWITPTHHGAYYYNKPPLWNWILGISFWLHGEASEWAARLPMVVALLAFGGLIYTSMRRELGKVRALLTALFFLTCGRVLLWESLLGLIDVFFSLVIYLLFWVVYHYERRAAWWSLFLASYGLMVIGYLLKGLPAIAFQGITLLVWLGYRKQWLQLLRIPHLASGLLSVLLLGAYYLIYHQYNDLELVLGTLVSESGKRTAAAYSIGDTVKHALQFPFELFYHFLPWTILGLSLATREGRARVWEQPFTRFAVIIGLANVVIYWLSPNFYPRYILMLVPLYFAVVMQAYTEKPPRWLWHSFRALGYLVFALVLTSAIASNFVADTQSIPYLSTKVIVLSVVIVALCGYYYRHPQEHLFVMVLAMLLFRLGFDLFVLPARAEHASLHSRRESVHAFADRWQERDLAVFYNTSMEMASSFYLENDLQRIVPRRPLRELRLDELYLFNPEEYDSTLFINRVDSFLARHNYQDYFYVGQLRTTDSLGIEGCRQRTIKGY